jgi:2-dehydropantoate 2-reductase
MMIETDNAPILIWGAGAIGGTIGAYLARTGLPVLMVDLVSDHVDTMNENGLSIRGPVNEFTTPIIATTPSALKGQFHKVLLCVKGQDTVAATQALKPHLAEDGYVASVQNGLNEETIAGIVGSERTIGAFINFGADYHGPGNILFGARSTVVVGELDGRLTPRIMNLRGNLRHFEPNAIASANIWGFLWSKLAYCSLLWANAVIDAELNDMFGSQKYRAMLTELTREVIRIAEKQNITLEGFDPFDPSGFTQDADQAAADSVFESIYEHRRGSAKKHSGMWRDIAVRKRKSELDTLLLPVLATGKKIGADMPLNTLLAELIRDLELGQRRQSWENFDLLQSRMTGTTV